MNRLLLDTHTFLWWDSAPERLSAAVLALCRDPGVVLYLSLVSLWEIAIKSSLIRPSAPGGLSALPLRLPLHTLVAEQQANGLRLLPITAEHVFALESLPPHHRDPFDRLPIAQAMSEGLPLASVDSQFAPYPVSVVW